MNCEEKRQLELTTMEKIIHLYCHAKHGTPSGSLCTECQAVRDYAAQRIRKCPHMATKTFCSRFKTHCYEPIYRQKIQRMMRWGGPRLIFDSPILVLRHMGLEWVDRLLGQRKGHQ